MISMGRVGYAGCASADDAASTIPRTTASTMRP
jgi:hypothetical protein